MLFQTFHFLVFFVFVAGGYFVAGPRVRRWLLLLSSYAFYMAWDARFGALILASTLVDFVAGIRIEDGEERARRRWLVLSLAANLGILAFFKYLGFFAEVTEDVLALLGVARNVEVWELVLPVGISFFTFQSMSHTIDVYRREIRAERSFVDFATYVAFFPQLVAGPIVRAKDFLPQLRVQRRFDAAGVAQGVDRILWGLFKKVVVADNLSTVVDVVFERPGDFDTPMAWLAAVCYAVQIYCDFAGYSDMAIGLAAVLGFRLRENFDFPYLSRSPSEFWTRWHVSLSSWLRDYLYVPLGGNRGGTLATLRNLLVTMLLGGLWHGASYTFVLWGAGHGLLLVAYRLAAPLGKRLARLPGLAALATLAMLLWVIALWIPFRAASLADAGTLLDAMFLRWERSFDVAMLNHVDLPLVFALLGGVVATHLLRAFTPGTLRALREPGTLRSLVWGTLAFAILQFHHAGEVPFVYFQF
jgi:D-alanyl-lipoteichoic acid acyltransferase DltB (MBOAT superfamily)